MSTSGQRERRATPAPADPGIVARAESPTIEYQVVLVRIGEDGSEEIRPWPSTDELLAAVYACCRNQGHYQAAGHVRRQMRKSGVSGSNLGTAIWLLQPTASPNGWPASFGLDRDPPVFRVAQVLSRIRPGEDERRFYTDLAWDLEAEIWP